MPFTPVSLLNPYHCRMERDNLFVFGDNLQRKGDAGQACIRHEPNAIGLPTKRAPGMWPKAFFYDADLPEVKAHNKAATLLLISHIRLGGTVYWPEMGIGTGLACLPDKAPIILKYYEEMAAMLNRLKRL